MNSKKPRFNTANEVFEAIPEIAQDMTARPDGEESVAWTRQLLESPTPEEAVTFCAYLLPRREAVWWGHECLRHLSGAVQGGDEDMLRLAENWVRQPDETTRTIALDTAMAADPKTPAAWVALGAGWSGGSVVAPDLAPVPPPPFATPRAVQIGVLAALARVEDDRATAIANCVEMGLEIATAQ